MTYGVYAPRNEAVRYLVWQHGPRAALERLKEQTAGAVMLAEGTTREEAESARNGIATIMAAMPGQDPAAANVLWIEKNGKPPQQKQARRGPVRQPIA